MTVRRCRQAIEDLDNIAAYFTQVSGVALAIHSLEAAEATLSRLGSQPGVGRLYETGSFGAVEVRVFLIRKFPHHLIFYREIPAGVEVLRVLHSSQNLEVLF